MIKIFLNNEIKELDEKMSIEQILLEFGFHKDKVAIAVNTEFVPRSSYANFFIKDNDRVDVLVPVQGG
jgi:sulfur carrier protein